MKRAIYAGSFDPLTLGHLDVIKRASEICDELIIGVLHNSEKKCLFSVEERVDMIKELTKDIKNIKVMSFAGLTIDFAKEVDAKILIRGLRAVSDFEYEMQIAHANNIEYNDLETVFLITNLKYSYLSSTVVKEFASYGADISQFVPSELIPKIMAKYNKEK